MAPRDYAPFVPVSAILVQRAFFFSVVSPDAMEPNAFIYLAYLGAAFLAAGLITMEIGLIRPYSSLV